MSNVSASIRLMKMPFLSTLGVQPEHHFIYERTKSIVKVTITHADKRHFLLLFIIINRISKS